MTIPALLLALTYTWKQSRSEGWTRMADNQYLLPLPLQVDPKVAFPRKSQPKVSHSFHHFLLLVLLVVSCVGVVLFCSVFFDTCCCVCFHVVFNDSHLGLGGGEGWMCMRVFTKRAQCTTLPPHSSYPHARSVAETTVTETWQTLQECFSIWDLRSFFAKRGRA